MPLHRYLVASLTLLLASAAPAANVSWSYDVSVNPANLISGHWHYEDHAGQTVRVVQWNSDYSVGFEGAAGARTDGGQVDAVRVSTFGVGFDSGNGDFDPTIHQFDVNFGLKDDASGASQTLTFHGTLSGTLDQFGAMLQASFDPLTQSATLGDNTYDVRLLPFYLSQSADDGSVQPDALPTMVAQVDVHSAAGDTPPPNSSPGTTALDTPEPATLGLAVLGFAGLGLVLRRGAHSQKCA